MYMASYYDLSVCCCIFFYKFYEQHIKSTSFFIDWCDESYGSSLQYRYYKQQHPNWKDLPHLANLCCYAIIVRGVQWKKHLIQ